jgi:hypothetical protein
MVSARRAGHSRRVGVCLILALLSAGAIAETVTSAEAFCFGAADIVDGMVDPVEAGTYAGARLSLDSAKGDALKGYARISVDSSIGFTLDRAYLKARLSRASKAGAFRLTLGKAPLSWGKGFVFNAGDPVFGAVPRVTGLSDGDYRASTAWMAVAYLPFGAFSFAEAAFLPRVASGGAYANAGAYPDTDAIRRGVAGDFNERHRAGLRVVASPRWRFFQSAETGFLASDSGEAIGYLAFDGSVWLDWYGAVSARWDDSVAAAEGPVIACSLGLFRMTELIPGHSLAFRLEALAYPDERRVLFYPSLEAEIAEGLSLLGQGFFACGDSLAEIASDANADDSAIAAFPWIDSGDALLSLGLSWTLLNDIALSGGACWRVEKGDSCPGLGVQAGFRVFF